MFVVFLIDVSQMLQFADIRHASYIDRFFGIKQFAGLCRVHCSPPPPPLPPLLIASLFLFSPPAPPPPSFAAAAAAATDHCAANTLPAYSFIEPIYFDVPGVFSPATDQHPSHDVTAGERFLKGIYEALRNSPAWNESLLVITWDEHGGFFGTVCLLGVGFASCVVLCCVVLLPLTDD